VVGRWLGEWRRLAAGWPVVVGLAISGLGWRAGRRTRREVGDRA
jgi:hypothetical protein